MIFMIFFLFCINSVHEVGTSPQPNFHKHFERLEKNSKSIRSILISVLPNVVASRNAQITHAVLV